MYDSSCTQKRFERPDTTQHLNPDVHSVLPLGLLVDTYRPAFTPDSVLDPAGPAAGRYQKYAHDVKMLPQTISSLIFLIRSHLSLQLLVISPFPVRQLIWPNSELAACFRRENPPAGSGYLQTASNIMSQR